MQNHAKFVPRAQIHTGNHGGRYVVVLSRGGRIVVSAQKAVAFRHHFQNAGTRHRRIDVVVIGRNRSVLHRSFARLFHGFVLKTCRFCGTTGTFGNFRIQFAGIRSDYFFNKFGTLMVARNNAELSCGNAQIGNRHSVDIVF